MVLQRYDDYYDKHGPYGAPIKNVIVRPIPDRQTQIAEFLTGNIDVIRNASADTARELAQNPDTRVTTTHAGLLMYVTLDAMGRSDNKAMMDQRVRKAFMEAIDRKELAKTVIPGGETADDPRRHLRQGRFRMPDVDRAARLQSRGRQEAARRSGLRRRLRHRVRRP